MEAPQELLDRLLREVEDIQASRMRLALAEDAARRSIERELHDGPQQDLVALAVNLQLARGLVEDDPGAASTLLGELEADVQRLLADTAKLAERIYPPLLESGGLAVALRAAAASTGARARVRVTGAGTRPPEAAGALYFCCRELLEWASEGASVAVDVHGDGAALRFDVTVHSSASSISTSDPLVHRLRDRVTALGGRLDVRPGPDHGVRVSGAFGASR